MSMFSKVCVYHFYFVPDTFLFTFLEVFHANVSVFFLNVNLSYSQKRKSEDLNGEATNGQNEVKKEEDDAEQVRHC